MSHYITQTYLDVNMLFVVFLPSVIKSPQLSGPGDHEIEVVLTLYQLLLVFSYIFVVNQRYLTTSVGACMCLAFFFFFFNR